jgi:hypothetical protein
MMLFAMASLQYSTPCGLSIVCSYRYVIQQVKVSIDLGWIKKVIVEVCKAYRVQVECRGATRGPGERVKKALQG